MDKYTDGQVTAQEIQYFYFPIKFGFGDNLILLNKTQIYGTGRNGDSKLYLNVQPNSTNTINENYNWTKWIYPSASSHHAHSWSENHNQVEIIQVC